MKWELPKDGDVKYEKVFAWSPIRVKNSMVWLEFVKFKYVYVDSSSFLCEGYWELVEITESR